MGIPDPNAVPRCPTCEIEIPDALAVDAKQAAPNEGSFLVCMNCGSMSRFHHVGGHLVLAQATQDDLLYLWRDYPDVFKIIEQASYDVRMGFRLSIHERN